MGDCREIIFMPSKYVEFGDKHKNRNRCACFWNCVDRNAKGLNVTYFKKKFKRNHIALILLDKHKNRDLDYICDSINHEVLHHAIYHIAGDIEKSEEMIVRGMLKYSL